MSQSQQNCKSYAFYMQDLCKYAETTGKMLLKRRNTPHREPQLTWTPGLVAGNQNKPKFEVCAIHGQHADTDETHKREVQTWV